MKVSILTAVFAATAEAAVRGKRQAGIPDVSQCGLDAFEGHTSEALLFCSNILRSGTATTTVTNGFTRTATTTTTTTVTISPSATPKPTPTPTPTPTSKPTSSTPVPPSSSSTRIPPSSSSIPSSTTPSSTLVSSTLVSSPSPTPTAPPSCGIAAYVKVTPAYYFESSGTKNTFDACSALCKADSKCKSFGYGEANCMLFDVTVSENTNLNPTSPYTFYDSSCPSEIPIRKRSPQLGISIGLPGGIGISLGLGNAGISSACSCLITSGPARTTVTRTVSSGTTTTSTAVSTVTTTKAAAK
ncbi:hypothetical protein COCC4DRAFT_36269 [Bipolaris maydis ATCC 48331]|uniref:Apple domain-containing protein n=2 Tax=Cochliobolus heterostrophus TaxID=5016 RepID=M2UPP8_COCH5|nr:uncharacterized protein COCC4DRAFT_36269 [Bipolaris maydis ATCC 48331]EMD89888.1 hypothetical protein COCHEDRAFT_1214931 [Bipolaris maydis C5]KAH7563259.1 hypothetical protein BM1_00306 [Bipolaris maydis]ENI09899.1 hypothetical protein COCC4DRAFT_36269 [Bipolaris maydis ATCC 48331]KAJ5025420.1 hypothetical protein J3E73DRAFT_49562 [Bipolaris maydis]KAJ5064020.1 hypothetical protein J3E74DRAFT_23897 [Bipolaris maydis]